MTAKSKIFVIVCASILLSTLGIYASDNISGLENNLFGLATGSQGPCDVGSKQLNLKGKALCLDTYEASAGDQCPKSIPESIIDTKTNISDNSCTAVSTKNAIPWRFISLTDAQQMCARTGKRLLTNEEWYGAVSGITDISQCAIDVKNGQAVPTGSKECVSPLGAYDMVGNVWEWIDAEIVDGVYEGREVPASGYVSLVDTDGFVLKTDSVPNEDFGSDYAWTNKEGVLGVVRGGFYASKSDAGIFAINATVQFDFRSAGIGFRCVKDI